jgi:hypothetical protein
MEISFFRRSAEKEGWPKWNIRGCLGMERIDATFTLDIPVLRTGDYLSFLTTCNLCQ